MEQIDGLEVLAAPLPEDHEWFRWYSEDGRTCLVLTRGGRLLEPFPTFGPVVYRCLARGVVVSEASAYARAHGFPHFRDRVA